LGLVLQERNRKEEAIAEFSEALKLYQAQGKVAEATQVSSVLSELGVN
jgi:hypothetical protein